MTKLLFINVEYDHVSELHEILCNISFEGSTMLDSEPPTERHPAVESIIRQLVEIMDTTIEHGT